MSNNEIQCPVDFVSMNENKARLTALLVLILGTIFLITGLWFIMAFLVIDFLLRANNLGKYSLLAILSDAVIKQLKIKNKPTDRAPKRFAAGVGLVFTMGILILTLLHLDTATLLVTLVLLLFAFLESFVGFCAGCYVYSMLQKLGNTFKNNQLKQ
jgi:bifunctional ADP-heptose synthase (sugar kinase/adenylyltransferase)